VNCVIALMDPRPVNESIVAVPTDVSTHSASVETDKATLTSAIRRGFELYECLLVRKN